MPDRLISNMSDGPPPLERISTEINHVSDDCEMRAASPPDERFARFAASAEVADVPRVGLKKGFLLKQSPPERATTEPTLEFLPKRGQTNQLNKRGNDSLVFPEVQAAMMPEWITPDLMKQVCGDSELNTAMNDPLFLQMLRMLKSDPLTARNILKANQQHQIWISKILALLGERFETLALINDTTKFSGKGMREASIEKPTTKAVSSDPILEEIIKRIQQDGAIDLRYTLKKYPHIEPKLKSLIEAGYLSVSGYI